jgi:hypothetical protein
LKKLPGKRNPIAKALSKPQYRPRIKPDKRQKIEAKRMKRQRILTRRTLREIMGMFNWITVI